MSQLESLIAAARDPGLHPGFVYDIVPTSSAIVDRKQGVPAYPTSATSLSQTGTRNCRIVVGSDGFCDASSVRLVFTINNHDTTKSLKFWSGAHGAWSSVRLLSQGTEIERIDQYGRHHEVLAFKLLPFQDQWAEAAVCGLGGSWDQTGAQDQMYPKEGRIEPNERAVVMHKLHLSMFNSQKNFAFTLLSSGGGTCFSASKRVDRYNLIRVFNQLLAEQHSHHLRSNFARRINCSTIL